MNKKTGLLIGSILVIFLGLFAVSGKGAETIQKITGGESSIIGKKQKDTDSAEGLDEESGVTSSTNDELEGLDVEEYSLEESANINGIIFSVSKVEVREVVGDPDIPLNDVYVDLKVKNTGDEQIYIDSSMALDLLDENNERLSKIESNDYIKEFVKPKKEISGRVAFQVPSETTSAKLKVTREGSEGQAGIFNLSLE